MADPQTSHISSSSSSNGRGDGFMSAITSATAALAESASTSAASKIIEPAAGSHLPPPPPPPAAASSSSTASAAAAAYTTSSAASSGRPTDLSPRVGLSLRNGPVWLLVQAVSILSFLLLVCPGLIFTFSVLLRDVLLRWFTSSPRWQSVIGHRRNAKKVEGREGRKEKEDLEMGRGPDGGERSEVGENEGLVGGKSERDEGEVGEEGKGTSDKLGAGEATETKQEEGRKEEKEEGEGEDKVEVQCAPTMACVAENSHMLSIPRRVVLSTVHAFSVIYCQLLNNTKVFNQERLADLVRFRPAGTPLITVSNHMSTVDDPFLWGQWRLRTSDPNISRWTLTAKDICFTNSFFGYWFRLAKCIPIDRWGGIYQDGMSEAISRLNQGGWLHIFPEGRITQEHVPLKRLKWGLASIIARVNADNPPIVLCVGHSGFETIMPETKTFGRGTIIPLMMKKVSIVVGEPMQFDIRDLKLQAAHAVATQSTTFGPDAVLPAGSESEGTKGVEEMHQEGGGAEGGEGGAKSTEKIEQPQAKDGNVKRRVDQNSQVKDEATRRLFAHITAQVKDQLETVVFEAHVKQKERWSKSKRSNDDYV